eukprot:5085995-Pyramimonas_sp.AAC.1
MPAAWRIKEACAPTAVTRRRPECWQPSTCKCQKHKKPHTPAVFQAFCDMDSRGRPAAVLRRLLDSTGAALGAIQARVLLALSLLLQREPRACLCPCGGAGGVGDVIEAILGMCEPRRPRDRVARGRLGALFGLQDWHFRELPVSYTHLTLPTILLV